MIEELSLKEIINQKAPEYLSWLPTRIRDSLFNGFGKLLRISDINKLLRNNEHLDGMEMLDGILAELDFQFKIPKTDLDKIPQNGGLLVVSNHPLGGLDAIALLRAIGEVRRDVKIVANELLMKLGKLKDFFLPYDVYTRKGYHRSEISAIIDSLRQGAAVAFFPGGDVSRVTLSGIRDNLWMKGPFVIASKLKLPILPVFISGRNSFRFYLLSLINRRLSRFFLADEIFRYKGKRVSISIKDPLNIESLNDEMDSVADKIRISLYEKSPASKDYLIFPKNISKL